MNTVVFEDIKHIDDDFYYNRKKDNQITNSLKSKAYENYKKQHPHSKMTFEEFKNR